jgi:hypothetical protein
MINFFIIASSVAIVISSFLVIDVAIIRRFRSLKEQRTHTFIQKWMPQLHPYLHSSVGRKPALPSEKSIEWLLLWVILGLSGGNQSSRSKLALLGKEIGLLELALEYLRGRSFENKLTALVCIGFLEAPSAWRLIVPLAYSSNLSLSLRAIETLTRLDSSQAVPFILQMLSKRTDWSADHILGLLGDISPTLISEYVRQGLKECSAKTVHRLIPLLALLPLKDRRELLFKYMTPSSSADVLIEGLKLVNQPKEISLAREFISHGNWQVRVEAAAALGRGGNSVDMGLLEPLLCDPVWWVRMSSAKTIFRIPDIKPKVLREIKMMHPDLFYKEHK